MLMIYLLVRISFSTFFDLIFIKEGNENNLSFRLLLDRKKKRRKYQLMNISLYPFSDILLLDLSLFPYIVISNYK